MLLLNVGWMLTIYVPLVLFLLLLVYWFYWRKRGEPQPAKEK